MNILDNIILDKRREVVLKKSIIPISQLEASVFFEKQTISLSHNLRNSSSGIIAEHKRRSPSKAEINYGFTVEEVVKGYETAKDLTKYKRMKKYHPHIILNVIGKKWFADNGKWMKKLILDW
jgi:hypothetical protein